MNKFLALLCTLVALSPMMKAQPTRNHLRDLQSSRFVCDSTYNFSLANFSPMAYYKFYYRYNQWNQLSSYLWYNSEANNSYQMYLFSYDAMGRLTNDSLLYAQDLISEWEPLEKNDYSYNGILPYSDVHWLIEGGNPPTWTNQFTEVYIHNELGRLVEIEYHQNQPSTGLHFISGRDTFEYNNNFVSAIIRQSRTSDTSSWTNTGKREFTRDNVGQVLEERRYSFWSSSNQQYNYINHLVNEFNSYGDIERTTNYYSALNINMFDTLKYEYVYNLEHTVDQLVLPINRVYNGFENGLLTPSFTHQLLQLRHSSWDTEGLFWKNRWYIEHYYHEELVPENVAEQETFAVKVFPNPATDELRIQSPQGTFVRAYHLVDLDGKVVATDQVHYGNSISLPPLAAGTYVLRMVFNTGQMQVQKVVVGF